MKLIIPILKLLGGLLLLLQIALTPFSELLATQEREKRHSEIISAISNVVVLQTVQMQEGEAEEKLSRIKGIVNQHVKVSHQGVPKIDIFTWLFIAGALCLGLGEILSAFRDYQKAKI